MIAKADGPGSDRTTATTARAKPKSADREPATLSIDEGVATATVGKKDRPVIVTKVRPPRKRRDLVSRARLIEYLSANVDRKLILVSAAAGYGKTTLLVDFIDQSGIPTCWYRLDDADRDLSVFFEHLIASLRQRFPNVCARTLAQLRSEANPDPEVLVGSLINEISSEIDEFFLLVFDDFHKLDEATLINGAMDFFLRYLPDNCRVVVVSRTLPKKLTLTRLAGEGQVLGVGQEHLRFRPEEIRGLVGHLHGETLSALEAEELAGRSEGWIAALVMGSAKLLDGMRTGLDLPSGGGGQLFDFLAAEVMATLPAETVTFLMQTAILEALSPEVCDAVTGRTDSARMLDLLEEQNLYLGRIAGADSWYRYHALFQDFLLARLAEVAPDDLADRHRAAAAWYAQHDMPDHEISHLLAAREYTAAAERIESVLPESSERGRWRTLEAWITALPETTRRDMPALLAELGVAYAYLGKLPEAILAENQAVEAYEARGDSRGVAAALMHRSYAWRFMGQIDAAMADAHRALALIDDDPESAIACELHRSLGACLSLRGDMAAAATELTAALAAYERLGLASHAAHTHADLSAMYQLSGNVASALYHAEQARTTFEAQGNLAALALALNNAGTAWYAMGRLDDARRLLEEAVRTARLVGVHRYVALALAGLADVEADQDNLETAIEHYQAALDMARESGEGTLVCYSLASLAEAHRLKGNLSEALQFSAAAREELAINRSAFEAALVDYVRGNIALDRLEFERSAEHLDDAARSFASMGARREQARALMYRVVAAQRRNDMTAADKAWRDAVDAVEAFSYVDAFAPQARRLPEVVARDELRAATAGVRALGLAALAGVATPFASGDAAADMGGGHAEGVLTDGWIDAGDGVAGQPAGEAGSGTAVTTTGRAWPQGRTGAAPRVRDRSRRGGTALDLPPAPIRVRAFGTAEVRRDGAPIEAATWETTTARELFLYLVDRPEGVHRDDVLLAFWPESTMPRATSTFHTTLHRLRRAAGRAVVEREGDRYFVASPAGLEYDVAEFTAVLDRANRADDPDEAIAHLKRATELARGDYLEGVEADWARERADQLRGLAVKALLELGKRQMANDAPAEAAGAYARAAELEPLDEEAHRGVMLAHAKSGERVKALQQYDRLAAALERELGVEPDATTKALRQAIKQKEPIQAA